MNEIHWRPLKLEIAKENSKNKLCIKYFKGGPHMLVSAILHH